MNTLFMGVEQQYQVKDANGVTVWLGGQILGQTFQIVNGGAAFLAGHAIAPHASTTLCGNYHTTADPPTATLPDAMVTKLYGAIAPATTAIGYLGVALTPAAVSTSVPEPTAMVAGPGSICAVQVTDAAISLGGLIGVSGTAGLCLELFALGTTPTSGSGRVLGICIKAKAALGAAGVPSGASGFIAGVLVAPN